MERKTVAGRDPAFAFAVARRLLAEWTVPDRIETVTLVLTGTDLETLDLIAPHARAPHFQCKGLVPAAWLQEVGSISDPREIAVALAFPEGTLNIGWLAIQPEKPIGILEANFTPHQQSLGARASPLERILRRGSVTEGVVHGMTKHSIAHELAVTARFNPDVQTVLFSFSRAGADLAWTTFVSMLRNVSVPDRAHVGITGTLEAIRKVAGAVSPCGTCCGWMYGFGNVAAQCSDVDGDTIDELCDAIRGRSATDRILRWSNLRWREESTIVSRKGNAISWSYGPTVELALEAGDRLPQGLHAATIESLNAN